MGEAPSEVGQRAVKKGLAYDLTVDWAEARWTGRCELTDLPFDVTPRGSGPKPFSPSVDRIDCTQGYVIGNCRIIFFGLNAMKGDGTDDEMLLVLPRRL